MTVKEKMVVLTDGYEKPIKSLVEVRTSEHRLTFSAWSGFGSLLTKELVTDNGQTIGERNRAALHTMLDEWLDNTWRDE
jgi:hypothetical protein